MLNHLHITSGFNFEGYSITEYLGYCSGECALGTGFLSTLGASLADFVGINSSMYEGKLDNARSMALDNLYLRAEALGANAIIGINISYTTFSSDIMGVIANGTAVKIESDNNIIQTAKCIPITNYNPDLPFRINELKISVNSEKTSCTVQANLLGKAISAISADIIFTTIFDDTYTLNNIALTDFMGKPQRSPGHISSPCICSLPFEITKILKSAKIMIRKYIQNEMIHKVDDNDMPLNPNERSDNFYSPENEITIEDYLSSVSQLGSASEIFAFTQNLNLNFLNSEMLDEIQSFVNLERLYGNAKDECIIKLKRYLYS